MAHVVAFTTASSQNEAQALATALVEERLVACVNIISGVQSVYRWGGKLCNESEWLLMMKTTEAKIASLKARLPELHSYETPELIVLPIQDGLPAYLDWVQASTV